MPDNRATTAGTGARKKRLRCGFSTGTAAVAAARAALRHLLTGQKPAVVAVRLPSGIYLPVDVEESRIEAGLARASVIKDAGDDPDITHRARISAVVRVARDFPDQPGQPAARSGQGRGIRLVAGKGVGVVTKAGLPVAPAEPAINPVPRWMLADNLAREALGRYPPAIAADRFAAGFENERAAVFVPFSPPPGENAPAFSLHVLIEVPRGEELALHTLNPRLGIVGGISILGTTGIVKPFSHEAYEETIRAALSVAGANGCRRVVLSTGGKSERFARDLFPEDPAECFVQIADFFAFSVGEAKRCGLREIVHSVFFGKALKMANGNPYTHAHSVALELEPLAAIAMDAGCGRSFSRRLASANTARHAFEMLVGRKAFPVLESVARRAVAQSAKLAGEGVKARLLLFDYDGELLADVS